jgi:hypothetical protein
MIFTPCREWTPSRTLRFIRESIGYALWGIKMTKPEIGVPATRRLIEEEHVPVVIGALCTPVTHAIMPMMQQAKVPLVIATSAVIAIQ